MGQEFIAGMGEYVVTHNDNTIVALGLGSCVGVAIYDEEKKVGGMVESAFKEMANIFSGAYLSSLSNMLSIELFPGIPFVANDMVQSIVDFVLIKISKTADEVLCVKTKIEIEGYTINGDFILMFNKDSLTKLLSQLRDKFGVS